MSDRPDGPDPESRDRLLRLLVAHLGQGKLPARDLVAALRGVIGPIDEPPTRRALLAELRPERDPGLAALAAFLRSMRFRDAQRAYELAAAGRTLPEDLRSELVDLPLGLLPGAPGPRSFTDLPALLVTALATNDRAATAVREHLQQAALAEGARAREAVAKVAEGRGGSVAGLGPEVLAAAAAAAFGARTARAERLALLDLVLGAPTETLADLLPPLCTEPWAQERASLALTLRFGAPYGDAFAQWAAWLGIVQTAARDRAGRLGADEATRRLLVWYRAQPETDPAVVAALRRPRSVDSLAEGEAFSAPDTSGPRGPGQTTRPPPVPIADVPMADSPGAGSAAPDPAAAPARPLPPPPPREGAPTRPVESLRPPERPAARRPPPPPATPLPPSPWREHVQGFLAENAYMAAGIVMVVVGASLLAYFTWDKHWLLRYTIMPGLLFAFTAALGRAATWLEGRDRTLRDTSATLRGAAVLLLPVNFMALALLAGDPEVTQSTLALPVMSLVYLALAGALLFDWTRGVDPRLVPWLPLALLAQNLLVLLRPLAAAEGAGGARLLVTGFHAGFLVAAGAVARFGRRVLDRELARDRRVSAFVGVTLVLTFLEVFVLVHGPAAVRPPLYAYAALPILAGALVLFLERRFLTLRGGRIGAESFLGYALVLLGILMGMGDARMRIATLLLAGLVWLLQAGPRREPLHHWIGMTLLVLGGASVGLLPGFPGEHLGVLGIALGVATGLLGTAAEGRGPALGAACRGLQSTVLVLASMVAVLTQWHHHSEPRATAVTLLVAGALLAWRAGRDQSLPLVHTVAALLALALPYLGFVDLGQRTLRGNTMPFGLAVLSWAFIGLLAVRRARLLVEARSTVLFLYGALALAGMSLRIVVEGRLAVPASLALAYREHLGPLLMAGALVFATWWSRSLLPASIASVLLVILFPALKANLQASFPALGWGSGFGSALAALALVLLSFRLREAPGLRRLEGGDLLFGQTPFPFRRFDHTLFTSPLLASALFLVIRVDTWTLARHLGPGVPLKTAVALSTTAVSWLLLAAYWRARPWAPLLVHPAWIALFLGLWFANERLARDPQAQWPLALTLLALQAGDLLLRHGVAPRFPWTEGVLADPLRGVARLASLLLALAVMIGLVAGTPLSRLAVLAFVVALVLVRTALSDRRLGAGSCVVGLGYVVLLAVAAPGVGPLADRLSAEAGLSETLALIVGIQIAQMLLELLPTAYAFLRPVVRPAQVLAAGLALTLGTYALGDAVTGPAFSPLQQWALLAGIVLSARANASGFLCLMATTLLYLFAHGGALRTLGAFERVPYLVEPLRLASFALVVAFLAVLGRSLDARAPGLLTGRDALGPLASPALPWLHAAAVVASLVAAGRHTLVTDLRHRADQLAAPWLAAATTVVVGWFSGPYLLYWVAVGLTSLGNVHAVRLFWGEPLREGGVSDVHLVAVGLGLTLLEGTVLRLIWRHLGVAAFVNRASLAVAGLVLALLTTNYAAHPDLLAMTPMRFAVSGAMALAAGLYFRRAARHPGPGEEAHAPLCEGLYHFGLAAAAWCAALLVPWFRQPSTVLLALGVPALGFWVRAELETGETGRRFRSSASVLGFVLLGLYALRPVFQMVLFPQAQIETDHYHYYAGLAMAVGLLLLRLHGLGGTSWLAFYGGLALISGSYFALTAWPGLSPFAADTVPAAWCAVALAHFWTAASAWRSPLRSFLQLVAGLDEAAWLTLRASWGRFVLLASQGLVVLGLVHAAEADTYAVAPLLLGAASVFISHAVLYASGWRWHAGLALVLLAIHADFALRSNLHRDDVVWVLLAVWGTVLFVPRLFGRSIATSILGTASALLAGLTMAQVFYHHPSSDTGLLAVALGALLSALTPRDTHGPVVPEETLGAALLLAVPTWLVYFGQAPLLEHPAAIFTPRAILLTCWSVFLTGLFARGPAAAWEQALAARGPRLLHHAVTLAARHALALHVAMMIAAGALALLLQTVEYGRAQDAIDVLLFLALYIALAVSFYREGSRSQTSPPYFAAEACLVLAFAVVRRQLMLTGSGWTFEHDIWASLGVSLLLAGSKQTIDERPEGLRTPFVFSILALPALALGWTQVHHLGVDLALLVVGLHSLMFAFLGRDRANSLYNLVATSGFVAFVLMLFWTKLELRVLHAYVIPVGLGVLVLLQLFGRELPADTRNRVRLVTLLAMLGSAGYYALVDDRHPVAFNLTLLLLCLAAMALGSLLRIRLYLVLGLAAVLVDVASIVVKVLVQMDRGERMTSVGLLVLVVGGALVSGAIYYKTHREEIEDGLDGWRRRLGRWE